MEIPSRIIEEIYVFENHGVDFRDWISMKKCLLKSIPSSMRKNFSTRDPRTKKQNLNDFERALVDFYENSTGKVLRLPQDV